MDIQMSDSLYLLKKEKLELEEKIQKYETKKLLYSHLLNILPSYDMSTSQEQLLLSMMCNIVNHCDSKVDVYKIKLNNLNFVVG